MNSRDIIAPAFDRGLHLRALARSGGREISGKLQWRQAADLGSSDRGLGATPPSRLHLFPTTIRQATRPARPLPWDAWYSVE